MIDSNKIKELFNHEEIDLRVKNGTFDFDKIQKKILSLSSAWNDPVLTENFLIFKNDLAKNEFISEYQPSKKYQYPYVIVISVRSNEIYFNLFAGEKYFEIVADLINWISGNYDCYITDTHGVTLFEN